ncbi:MAG: ROK family protein [Fidelibacterota bacterium]
MHRIGIDLGGTKTEGIIIAPNGEEIHRVRFTTPQADGYDAILAAIGQCVNTLRSRADGPCTIGICTPGTISSRTGCMKNSNTRCLNGRTLQQDLEQILEQAIFLDNDANCFALAESIRGAGKGYQTVFGVIMGTGVGGGIVMQEKIWTGSDRIAGEWGHHKIHLAGRRCYCGQRGCVETYISGPALEKHWVELTGQALSLPAICRAADHPYYQQWKNDFLTWFGIGLANVINILDPEVVILGGGVSNVSFLYTEGVTAVHQYVFSDHPVTPVRRNHLGDSAGVIGAAWLGEWS